MSYFKKFTDFNEGFHEAGGKVLSFFELPPVKLYTPETATLLFVELMRSKFPSPTGERPQPALNISPSEVSFRAKDGWAIGWRYIEENGEIIYSFRITDDAMTTSNIALLLSKGWLCKKKYKTRDFFKRTSTTSPAYFVRQDSMNDIKRVEYVSASKDGCGCRFSVKDGPEAIEITNQFSWNTDHDVHIYMMNSGSMIMAINSPSNKYADILVCENDPVTGFKSTHFTPVTRIDGIAVSWDLVSERIKGSNIKKLMYHTEPIPLVLMK